MSVPIEGTRPARPPAIRGVRELLWLWLGGCVARPKPVTGANLPDPGDAGAVVSGRIIRVEFGDLGLATNVPIRLHGPGREAEARTFDQVADSAGQAPPESTHDLTAVTAKAPRTKPQSHWPSASRSTEE